MHHHTPEVPPWARRIDDYGKRRRHKDKPLHARRGEYIANIVFNLLFLWIVNNIAGWNVGFIRDNFNVVLWVLNLNILVQIGGNALMLISEIAVLRYFSRMVMEASGFVTQMVLFYIYPFDFSNFHGLFWLDRVIPVILIIGMVVSAIKVVANLWKLIFRWG